MKEQVSPCMTMIHFHESAYGNLLGLAVSAPLRSVLNAGPPDLQHPQALARFQSFALSQSLKSSTFKGGISLWQERKRHILRQELAGSI